MTDGGQQDNQSSVRISVGYRQMYLHTCTMKHLQEVTMKQAGQSPDQRRIHYAKLASARARGH